MQPDPENSNREERPAGISPGQGSGGRGGGGWGGGQEEAWLCTAGCQPRACKRGIPENSPSMAKKSASSMAWYTLWRLLLKSAEKPRRGSVPVAGLPAHGLLGG